MGALAQYPFIQIADVQVSPDNQDNITSDYISGTVRYDSTTRTLTLQNAYISEYVSPPDYIDGGRSIYISGRNQRFTIELIGDNVVVGLVPIAFLEGDFDIKGPGSLTLNGQCWGICGDLGTTSIRICQGADVRICMSSQYTTGIFCPITNVGTGDTTTLVIDNSRLVVTATRCIGHISGFQLIDSHIAIPEGAYFNPDSLSIVTAGGGIVTEFLEILPGNVGVHEAKNPNFTVQNAPGGLYVTAISDFSNVEVVNMLGQTVYGGRMSSGKHFIPLQKGFYVVRADDYATKVVVN
ncbi:MAG: hypothetical protein J5741_03465 [Bacteroidales bacterium]|nr:hypothetical protein [Bacteroidales bacterium]